MKFLAFSFKNEAVWILIFSLGLAVIGFLILLTTWLLRR
jgi:hypothetical protein